MADLMTEKDLQEAVEDLSMLPYFPTEARGAVMRQLAKMCPHKTALKWLISQVVDRVGKWPGPSELRGILCSRYDSADGIDVWSTLPGYTPADGEARSIAEHEQRLVASRDDKQAIRLLETKQ